MKDQVLMVMIILCTDLKMKKMIPLEKIPVTGMGRRTWGTVI